MTRFSQHGCLQVIYNINKIVPEADLKKRTVTTCAFVGIMY